jgi:hypothetical protein
VDDQNVFTFTPTLGLSATALIQENSIETEDSIVPFISSVKEESVLSLPSTFRFYHYVPSSTAQQPLAEIRFNKADRKTQYQRSYNTVDEYLAYVGGLIGTIIGLMFVLGIYNQKAYEISLAHKLFKDNEHNNIESRSFNIGYFLLMFIKTVLNIFQCSP